MNGTLREMTDFDTGAVLGILSEAISEGSSTGRYVCPTKEEWEDSLMPIGRYVYEESGAVLGFTVLHPFSQRPCYSGVAEISIYITAKARGKGIGRLLLRKLIEESEKKGIRCLTSNIYATNTAGRRLHETLGFREVGFRERLMKTIKGEWMSVVIYELRLKDA